MNKYIISTDSTGDIHPDLVKKHNIILHPLYYYVNGEQYGAGHELPMKEFFDSMRNDAKVSTSASNPDVIRTLFEQQVGEGYEVLHLSFSSGLSCSYQNAVMVANEVMENHPGSRIVVIDTLAASGGQGLIAYKAILLKEQGKTLDEVADWVRENIQHTCHQFTVEDLKYLWRGGRISKTVQILGTLINVKPVLHVDEEGHLVPVGNVRGRKKSLNALLDNMASQLGGVENDVVFINHGDCIEDAEYVAQQVRERFGIQNIVINYISPTIGSHSGPGTLALFHMGKSRNVG